MSSLYSILSLFSLVRVSLTSASFAYSLEIICIIPAWSIAGGIFSWSYYSSNRRFAVDLTMQLASSCTDGNILALKFAISLTGYS